MKCSSYRLKNPGKYGTFRTDLKEWHVIPPSKQEVKEIVNKWC